LGTPPLFFAKSAEAIERKAFKFYNSAKMRKRVRKGMK